MSPRVAVGVLVALAGLLVGPAWLPGRALLLCDLVTYFPSLYGALGSAWDPWVQAGTPHLPNPQAGWFYPPAWLLAADFLALLPLYCFVHFAMAGVGAWAWLRASMGDRLGPLLGGVCYAACGPTFSLAMFPDKLPGHAALPWVLLGLHLLLCAPGRGRSRAWVGWLVATGAVAVCWLAGSLEAVIMAGLIGPLWAAFVGGDSLEPRGAARRWGAAAGTIVAGTALAACLLVPFLYLLPELHRAAPLSLEQATKSSTHPVDWLGWIAPNPFWRGEDLTYRVADSAAASSRWLRSIYGGATALLLLALVPWRGRRRGDLLALGGLLGFALLALGDLNPLRELIHRLPGISAVRYPEKWWLGTVPCVAWLVARGWEALEARPGERGRGLAMAGLVWAGLPALVLWLVGLGLVAGGGPLEPWARALLGVAPMVFGLGLAGLLWSRGVVRARVAGIAVAALMSLDLLLAAWASVPFGDADSAREPPAVARAIAADAEGKPYPPRVWGETFHVDDRVPALPPGESMRRMQRNLVLPNLAQPHGVAYTDGMRATRLMRQAQFSRHLDDVPLMARRALLRAVGNDYWVVYNPRAGRAMLTHTTLRPVKPAPGTRLPALLLAEPEPLGRLRLVPGRAVLPDQRRAWRALISRDPARTVVLVQGDPGVEALARLPQGKDAGPVAARSFSYRYLGPGQWQASWETAAPSALVLQEAWTHGWEVSLDGGPFHPAARVDHLLVGALAPAGKHTALLRYRVPGLGRGYALSLISLAGVLLMAWRLRRRRQL